jgi:acyl-homoserine-lactone acylase
MNDSYWLSNPDQRLEGFSPIIGNEREPRSFRTRAGLGLVAEALANDSAVTVNLVEEMLFSHRHYGAELFLDEVLAVCADEPALTQACSVLANWGRRQDVDSVGAHIFNEFWNSASRLRDHYAVAFDVNDPANTPRGLTIDNDETRAYLIGALKSSVTTLQEMDIPLNAKRGDVQFAVRNGEKIGIPGGAGMFSVITSRLNAESGGYSPITHGNSYIQTVTWNADGSPSAEAILTYFQSPEPDSPFYSDLTKLYSGSEWIKLPFSDSEIQNDLVRKETLLY